MNRLVIIGNGFDLAHGLPTSYRDFIDDFWKSIISNYDNKKVWLYESEIITIQIELTWQNFEVIGESIKQINTYFELVKFVNTYSSGFNPYQRSDKNDSYIKFHNKFFETICSKMSIENWVDIENEYYFQLIDLLLPKVIAFIPKEKKEKEITILNREFEEIKKLLSEYLMNKIDYAKSFNQKEIKDFLNILDDDNYSFTEFDKFFDEFPPKIHNRIKEEHVRLMKTKIEIPKFFLNFNYTYTLALYLQKLNLKSNRMNQIHGKIDDEANPINFGFGDEMDKNYQKIEEKNDNEYLRNIKSFQYLHTPNYKNLLDLIDSEIFQVFILGHSCGLSDRILLNTIFEHENCCSIKVFYHQKNDGLDNYTEIIQNISRHFNKKKLMREKIVNKTLCQPLPQIQLPKKA
ncbi:AbiH family protein [Flavobacterium sp.]|uniref:AbiH family protein n=1 Tax=Flavobacterium sp. TaxID=239 RepID=UPI00261DA972|nr:AbiH family protein [Flavobacterium sp.]